MYNNKNSYIIELINNLNLIELNSLISLISDLYDLKSISSTNEINQSIGNSVSEDIIKKDFDLIIEDIKPDKKITLLKFIKSNFNFSLKESKDIIDNLPKTIKKLTNKEEAENLKKKLEECGAVVSSFK